MAEIRQKIFSSVYVEELRNRLQSGSSLSEYFSETYSPSESKILKTSVFVEEDELNLKILDSGNQADADLENSKKIYGIYKNLSETQASDPRLWTYLSHCTFRQYTMKRWGFNQTYKEIENDAEGKKKAQKHYLSHWFALGSDRALRRNALARLWWAAHLTMLPKDATDPFRLTKILFSTQDIFQQVLERSIGRDPRIRIPVLDYIGKHSSLSREKIRTIIKELNLIASVRNISFLDRDEIDELLSSTDSRNP